MSPNEYYLLGYHHGWRNRAEYPSTRLTMWLTSLVTIGLLASGSLGKPAQVQDVAKTCQDIFEQNGIDFDQFGMSVAHGIHSLYLEDIRYFFDPDAPEDNGIPVLNSNFSAPDRIWPNSPLMGYDSSLLR